MISLWHDCRGILGHSSLLQFNGVCRHSCRHSSLKGPPPHFRQVDFDHYNTFFSFPAVLFVLVLEIFVLLHDPVLGFSCLTDDPPFDSKILLSTEEFVVSATTARCPAPVLSPEDHHFTTMLDSLYEVFVLMCSICFSPNMVLSLVVKHVNFSLWLQSISN